MTNPIKQAFGEAILTIINIVPSVINNSAKLLNKCFVIADQTLDVGVTITEGANQLTKDIFSLDEVKVTPIEPESLPKT